MIFIPAKKFFTWWLPVLSAVLIFSCSDKDDPKPLQDEGYLVEATVTGSRAAAELQFFIQFSGRDIDPALFDYDVDIYNVVYKTTYRDEEILASGLILLPKTTAPVSMVSFQHGTIVREADAPSVLSKNSEEVISYAALASMGFIAVIPDMIGFGESSEIPHPYYVEEPTAAAVLDMLKAALELAAEKQIAFNSRLFLAGYSQGGYSTLAAHKALESNPLDDFELIASFPGAGGYDIGSMQEYFFGLDTYDNPYYLAYVGLSYQSYYDRPDLLTRFFREPYAENIPALFDGIKSSEDINGALNSTISELVTEEMLVQSDADPEYKFLRDKFAENSLVDWKPVAPVFFYHGDADVTVPFENSQVTYNKLIGNGANPEDIQLIKLAGRDHNTAIEPYIEDVIRKLESMRP